MKRTFVLVALLWGVIFFCSSARPSHAARKMFIRDVVLHGSCVKEVSVDALRALLAQEMPRDILLHRGLAYEDLSTYLDAGNWNAESFTVREARNIMARVRQFDMQMMLWLEVSCLPGAAGTQRYVLTGRLMDLDRMDQILTCQDAQARDQRRVCHGSGDVYDAVTFAQANMDSFDTFVPAVRHLLARLLRIPEVEIRLDTSAEVFDPGQRINLSFSVRRNDEHQSSPIRVVQKIIRLPADQRRQICLDPEQFWEQHGCSGSLGSPGKGRCPEPVRFDVIDPGSGTKSTAEGGPYIRLHAPSYEADFLLRAEAVTSDSGGEIRSTPEYRCLHVRERKYQIGVTLRGGTPIPAIQKSDGVELLPDGSQGHSSNYLRLSDLVFGVDLSVVFAVIPRGYYRPGIELAVVLGGTYVRGTFDVNSHSSTQSYDLYREAASWTSEVRGQVRLNALRFRRIFFQPFSDLGLGAEALSNDPEHVVSGANFVAMGGLGMNIGGTAGLGSRWDLGWTFGFFYQWRLRVSDRQATETVPVSSIGGSSGAPMTTTLMRISSPIPALWQPLWFTLGLSLASPPQAR